MQDHAAHGHACHPRGDSVTHTDPVCGMRISANPDRSVVHDGETYYFCSDRCADKFRGDPEGFVRGEATIPAPARKGVKYTCPMHPEIVRDGPGDRPICGMALEPVTISAEPEDNPELIDMRRRFRVSAVLTLPLLVIATGEMLPGLDPAALLGATLAGYLQGGLGTPVVLWGGGRPLSAPGSPSAA